MSVFPLSCLLFLRIIANAQGALTEKTAKPTVVDTFVLEKLSVKQVRVCDLPF